MKKYIKYISLIFLIVFFLTFIILFSVLSSDKSLDMPMNALDFLNDPTAPPPQGIKSWIDHPSGHSLTQKTIIWMEYLGFDNFILLSKNPSWNFYVIDSFIILPILFTITFFEFSVFVLVRKIRKYRRVTVVDFNKVIAIIWWFMLFLTLFLIILSMIVLESFEVTSNAQKLFKYWYGKGVTTDKYLFVNKNYSILLDSIRMLNIILVSNGIHNTGGILNNNLIPINIGNFTIILIIVSPIMLFISLIIFILNISTKRVLYEYNLAGHQIKKVKLWIFYRDIPSIKELKERMLKETAIIIMFITFLFAIIFPVFIPIHFLKHPIFSTLSIISSITVLICSFIPTIIAFNSAKNLRQNHYNLYIFAQIVTFFSAGILFQVFLWMFFRNKFIYLDFVPLIVFLVYLITSYIAITIFIRNK